MKRILATGAAVATLMGVMTGASADQGTVYDGTRDAYVMQGIQQVYAVGEFGTEAYFPALTMDACEHEDGTGPQCVWHAPSRDGGDGVIGRSYVQLNNGGEFGDGQEIAYVNHEAARVLLKPSEPVVSVQDAPSAPVVQESAPVVSAPVQESAPVESHDVTDDELVGMGYTVQEDGSATRELATVSETEPVEAIAPVCSTPYGPEWQVCGPENVIYDAITGERVEAPSVLKTVSGKAYADPTARKVRICEPKVWETHCATVKNGGQPVFITGKGDGDYLDMSGFKLDQYGDTGLFTR